MRVFVALILLALPSVAFAQQPQQPSIDDLQAQVRQLRIARDQVDFEAVQAEQKSEMLQKQVGDLQKQLEAARKVPAPPTARATPVKPWPTQQRPIPTTVPPPPVPHK